MNQPIVLPVVVTAEWLEARYQCPFQLARFREVFPHGAAVNRENLILAGVAGLLMGKIIGDLVLHQRAEYDRLLNPVADKMLTAMDNATSSEANNKAWCEYATAQANIIADILNLPGAPDSVPHTSNPKEPK